MDDLISRQALCEYALNQKDKSVSPNDIMRFPSAQPERLTDDDFETIRIHLNAYKEKLCNQQRWEEAEEYQRIIDRFMAFASAQPEPRTAYWTKDIVGSVVCSNCGGIREDNRIGHTQWCNCCGCFMRGEQKCLTESFGNSDLYPRRNW
jgi:hypothetical protein